MCIKKTQQNKMQNKTLKCFIRGSDSKLSYINSDGKNVSTAGDNSPAAFLKQLNLLYRFLGSRRPALAVPYESLPAPPGSIFGFEWATYPQKS